MDSSASPILLPSHCMTTKIYPPIYPLWGIAIALVFDYTVSHDEPLVAVNGLSWFWVFLGIILDISSYTTDFSMSIST